MVLRTNENKKTLPGKAGKKNSIHDRIEQGIPIGILAYSYMWEPKTGSTRVEPRRIWPIRSRTYPIGVKPLKIVASMSSMVFQYRYMNVLNFEILSVIGLRGLRRLLMRGLKLRAHKRYLLFWERYSYLTWQLRIQLSNNIFYIEIR